MFRSRPLAAAAQRGSDCLLNRVSAKRQLSLRPNSAEGKLTMNGTIKPRKSVARRRARLLVLLLSISSVGCSIASLGKQDGESIKLPSFADDLGRENIAQASKSDVEQKVANPQAKTIRFEGNEWVLGNGQQQGLSAAALSRQLEELLDDERYRSAQSLVALHRRSAHAMVLAGWTQSNNVSVEFAAQILDDLEYGGTPSNYASLVAIGEQSNEFASAYRDAQRLCGSEDQAQRIRAISQVVTLAEQNGHPLLVIESKRLVAAQAMLVDQPDEALAKLQEAMKLAAAQESSELYSGLSLMACQASQQKEDPSYVAKYWEAAVVSQLSVMTAMKPSLVPGGGAVMPELDCQFWEQASKLRPPNKPWPREVALAASPWAQQLGIGLSPTLSVETVLSCAMARKQMVSGQPELAIVFLKQAELEATEELKPWLRIAQARCLSAQGQPSVAATLLAEPASHDDLKVRSAALAMLGSTKLHSGAFAQGAQIIHKALDGAGDLEFPGRLDAEADLANAKLILGEVDEALVAVHDVQQKFVIEGRWQALAQSLENEARILELEKRPERVVKIRQRINQLEQI